MDLPAELNRLRRISVLSVAVLFMAGVGLVAGSLLWSGEAVDWSSVAYDFGLGVLIATGVATVVTMFLSRLEGQGAAYIASQREQADRARRENDARWANIQLDLEQLARDMTQTTWELKVSEESRNIRSLIVDTVEPILTQLYEFRANVDPKFEHPQKPLVDAILERLRAEVDGERMAAETSGRSGSAGSLGDPVD